MGLLRNILSGMNNLSFFMISILFVFGWVHGFDHEQPSFCVPRKETKAASIRLNALIKCEQVIGVKNGDQLLWWFERPLQYSVEAFDYGHFILRFEGIDKDSLVKEGALKKLALMQGVLRVTLSEEGGLSLVILYDAERVCFKFHHPPGSTYLKIDSFPVDTQKISGASRPRIVIDAGHGGDDFGAVGVNGVKEKDINLIMARGLYRFLKTAGYDVSLIRDTDVFVSIEEKTTQLQEREGTLFICLHANYSLNTAMRRIEIYPRVNDSHATDVYLGKEDQAVKARAVFYASEQHRDSLLLAHHIKTHFMQAVGEKSPFTALSHKATGVEVMAHNPFRTLLLSTVPAVLVEVGYVTNPVEAYLLTQSFYQAFLVDALGKAVESYLLSKAVQVVRPLKSVH